MEVESQNKLDVLVTGCSAGIGRETARLLARRGHRVIGTSRNPAGTGSVDGVELVELDVRDPQSVAKLAASVGSVDVVVNNAGVGMRLPVEMATADEMRAIWETNVLGSMLVAQAFIPAMRERGRGRLVTVSSVAGRRAMPFTGHYAATKHALEALNEALRWELRDFGIDVVIVEPGAVSSGFGDRRVGKREDFGVYTPLAEYMAELSPRINAPAESVEYVAEVVADAVEMDDPPLRIPTSAESARMIADRTDRSDAEFEGWLFGRNAAES
ncbi:SDR family oxidoreductase [Nocardia sp. NPDC052278]|uniref:SDR family oxidoreductase n=1 Tax=unclassified Nocardia TaxID=2637762 RepID=UPI00367C99A1